MSWVSMRAWIIALSVLAGIAALMGTSFGYGPLVPIIKGFPITVIQTIGIINLFIAFAFWKKYI